MQTLLLPQIPLLLYLIVITADFADDLQDLIALFQDTVANSKHAPGVHHVGEKDALD
jgi:hypothetical protein